MAEKWKKLSKKELASTSSSSSNYSSSSSKSSSFFSRSSSSKSPLLRSLSQKHAPNSGIKSPSDLPRSSSLKNASSSSSIGHKCSSLAKEQKARFYIMRRCVAMLVCWHKHGDP